MTEPLLAVEGLHKAYPVKRNLLGRVTEWHQAVNDVSFTLQQGRTLGLVGETGAGKSTVGRLVARLIDADRGSVRLDGNELVGRRHRDLRPMRHRVQMIFQDPFSSLDPKIEIGATIGEALLVNHGMRSRADRAARALELLESVGLGRAHLHRFPREMSGGQLQRVAIARALASEPSLIICDEPVSALDASVRAQVINLLLDLQEQHDIAYLFISHDLAIVRHVVHDIAVMSNGHVVEKGSAEAIFASPQDPYTKTLLASMPVAKPRRPQAKRAVVGAGFGGPNTDDGSVLEAATC